MGTEPQISGAAMEDSVPATLASAESHHSAEARDAGGLHDRREERVRLKLSLTWTSVSLTMVGIDVLSSYLPGSAEEIIAFAGGAANVRWFMLAGMVIYAVPFSMLLLSRLLRRGVSRWLNVGAAVLSAVTIVGGGSSEPHYVLGAALELLALSYIAWLALTWPKPATDPPSVHGRA
jgi:hypothetical protein